MLIRGRFLKTKQICYSRGNGITTRHVRRNRASRTGWSRGQGYPAPWAAALVAVGMVFASAPAASDARAEDQRAIPPASTKAIQTPVSNRVRISGRTLGGAINGSPSSNCSCRYKGKDVLLGKSICMKTPGGFVQAQCSRYLNNTSWTITRKPCTLS